MSSVPDEDNKHNEELIEYLNKHMSFYAKSDYYMASEKFLIAGKFRDMTKRIRTMEVHDDDTWILTFPRSGTAWSREMIWLIANDLDFKGAETDLNLRFPLLELGCLFQAGHDAWHESTDNTIGDSIDFVVQMPRPRFIWSHLPVELLPR